MLGAGNADEITPAAPPPDPPPWDGDLTFLIQCRTDRNTRRGSRHPVSIHRDWSVTTPHDLNAERVGMAFGGYSSCVDLVDRTIPALRQVAPLLARTRLPAVVRDKHSEFQLNSEDVIDGCCGDVSFRSVDAATAHLRSVQHIANTGGHPPLWQVRAVIRAVEAACTPDVSDTAQIAARIREPGGLAFLWSSGIHPDDVPALAVPARAVAEPLPVEYFLGVAYASVEPEWFATVLEHRPDPDVAAWLAWAESPPTSANAREWGLWLGFGIRRTDIAFAVHKQLLADTVVDVARATGWSVTHAATMVVNWGRSGCRATAEHFRAINRRGLDYSTPSKGALDALSDQVHQLPEVDPAVTDSAELGTLLVLLGNRPAVLAALRTGIRTSADLDRASTEPRPHAR